MYQILVCDDDKEIVEAIDIFLSQEGYRIFKAYDGEQAIEILVNGADVSTMPIGYLPAERCELTVNKTTADTLGIDISGLDNAVVVE